MLFGMYTGATVPFYPAKQRTLHFKKHGHEFGAADEFEYERMADAFMSCPMHANMLERRRAKGDKDRLRLHVVTRHFGVACGVLTVKTYFVVTMSKFIRDGGPTGYIDARCAEVR